jgi:adenosine deaminase
MLVLYIRSSEETSGMAFAHRFALWLLCVASLVVTPFGILPDAHAQRPARAQLSPTSATPQETRAAKAFETARAGQADALALESFLRKMPKGGDLHMHLSGAIYAETFLKDAVQDGICVNPKTSSLVRNAAGNTCAEGNLPASAIFKDQKLYDALIDAFSMRAFVPTPGVDGHDQFFATFDRFGGLDKSHNGEWLDEVATRAAAQNEQYLEVMLTPTFTASARLGYQLGWPSYAPGSAVDPQGDITGTTPQQLSGLRDKLLAGAVRAEAEVDRKEIAEAIAVRARLEHCGQPDARPACAVTIRFIYQLLRSFPPQQVFAQTLLGFEVAGSDPNVVGINLVQPEDNYLAMTEYSREMHMLDYLHGVYPRVHITLHAGELAPGLVPPEGTSFHIREAVEIGHAERIGHGVDVMYETDPDLLLQHMAERHIMVEINLTSNAVILDVVPPFHPLPLYREAHVPVALSTDDEGVSRIDITHEYVRAARDFHLGYMDLKLMARTSIEHSFLPGDSLWEKSDVFTRIKPACAAQKPSTREPNGACLAFLKSSEKAAQQWELEHRFSLFEAGF